MINHPYYRSHNLEEIKENCYDLNVEIDNGDGKKPFVMAIIYKKPVTAQEMDIYNTIESIIKNDDPNEAEKEFLIMDTILESRIQQLMINKPDDFDKIYGRYIFYLNYVKDIKLDHMLGTSSKDKKIDW